nr:hypothetical protein BDOA9_0153970 [Bradyrhizobium sp. DOA9]
MVPSSISRQLWSRTAIDCGLPFAAAAGLAAASVVPALVPLGLTCTSGLSPTIGGFSVCANAEAE